MRPASERSLVKCLDCGRDNLPSTRFCAGCGAALRIELPVRDPARALKRMRKAFARRSARERAQVRGEARELASVSRRLDLVLAAVAVLTTVATWWGLSTAVSALNRPPSVVAVAPLPVPPPGPDAPAEDAPGSGVQLAGDAAPMKYNPAAERRPALEAAEGEHARRAALNRNRAAAAAQEIPVEPVEADAIPVEAVAVPVAAPVAPLPRDRWQQRDDAIAQCAGGPIDRLFCEQRARATACEGLWGQAPDCPSGRTADYGN